MSATKPAAPEPTEIGGRYQVVQKLGAGAFGTVYKASDKRLRGRMVAIKTIRLEGLAASTASLEDLLKRFKLEADIAANLKHPNIVTIYDIGESDGLTYLAMEFIDGVGLDRVISGSGKMSVERAASIGAQVADALAYAHKHGVVHRDIKPANIMVEPGDHVKVTDFGIAKMTDQGAEHLTMTGSLLGTPSYMSPEQARAHPIDGRSDLFAVGCLLYEMVAGQKAFRGDSITALLFKIIAEEPPSLRELDPTVTDEMLRIIGKALSKAPETRYQTGGELADDLRAVTRPGFVPTLRATDTPTLPPDAPPRDVPTVASPPTIRPEPTLSSAPTTVQPAPGPSARSAPGAPPPLPPTILNPPTERPAPQPQPAKAAPPRPTQPQALVSRPAARNGGGGLLIVGLGLAAILALVLIAGGAWYLFGRARPQPQAASVDSSRPPATPESVSPATSAPPETTSPAEAPAPAGMATPAPQATAPASPGVADGSSPARAATPAAPVPPPRPGPGSPAGGATGGGDYAYLDEVPAETADGRAAGEALAQKYRTGGSGSSGGYPATRFARRQRVPQGITVPERPAVATLLYIHSAQEAYHRKSGRYGNLREIADAGFFVLDVPFEAEAFRRARYGFRVTTEADGYRVEAAPQGPVGRAFIVDDSGFVRLRDD